MQEKILLAPGVVFNEDRHEYHKNGRQLSGVTGVIGKHLKVRFPEEFVGEARGEGLHVHKAIEMWINTRGSKVDSVHPGVVWLAYTLRHQCAEIPMDFAAEVLVSDGFQYASAVDIVGILPGNRLHLFDMKRTFKRPSVTIQLNVYRYFIEKYTPYTVAAMHCAAFRDLEYYPILMKNNADIEKILYGRPL